MSEAASQTIADFAGGFSIDENYSQAEPDDRMSQSFAVCWDRVEPDAWGPEDEDAAGMLAPNMADSPAHSPARKDRRCSLSLMLTPSAVPVSWQAPCKVGQIPHCSRQHIWR
ncbi:hypothetical protein GCM10007919_16120 [Rhizobium indigoferae]|nr:hypothetical protein GCM10007919_16120 [Rhizobium indigoferae]